VPIASECWRAVGRSRPARRSSIAPTANLKIEASSLPTKILTQPLRYHAIARFGLSKRTVDGRAVTYAGALPRSGSGHRRIRVRRPRWVMNLVFLVLVTPLGQHRVMEDDMPPCGRSAPLIALDAVVLDTETTGLDARVARLVQVGALPLSNGSLVPEKRFESPGRRPSPRRRDAIISANVSASGSATINGRRKGASARSTVSTASTKLSTESKGTPSRRLMVSVSALGSVVMNENSSRSTLAPSFLMGPFHCR
jgi:hypothetical protein